MVGLPTGLVIVGVTPSAAKVRASSGPLVVGVLTSVHQDGMSKSGLPLLKYAVRFTVDGGPETDAQQVVGRGSEYFRMTDMDRLKPGTLVPVRYDPTNPTNALLALRADPKAVRQATNQYLLDSGRATSQDVHIRDNGVLATGVVLASHPTGRLVDEAAVVLTQVEVTCRDQTTFQVTTTQPVTQRGIPQTVPGSVVKVFYLPHDKQAAVVDFEPRPGS